ncbi:EAL domain-containing protein [Sphingomonas sp. R647]|uniref:EAL domain-containing protein n=1 Tax=Sphingomonas sp. R647 TaxID=2875233 RepID=UPI001CD5C9F6|nr:EAL domain-containing protein [Sphingomonas sp. R647]MCA1196414.1 EAL domain-containing protein [Sphingomonas sp. R647]
MTRGVVASALLLSLAACDSGLVNFGGEGRPIDAQATHPSAIVLQVLSLNRSGERAGVAIRVLNGRDRDIQLNAGNEQSYILTDSGERLPLVPSTTTRDLAVPPGKMIDGLIVFAGKLPSSGTATLIFNGNSSRAARATLQRLKAHGIRIVMDDFGTGYSSLSNLQAFPFDKINRGFIAAMEHDDAALSIVRAVVGLGTSLRLPIVAEGVETEAQYDCIMRGGCAEAQGYLFGAPSTAVQAHPRLCLIDA